MCIIKIESRNLVYITIGRWERLYVAKQHSYCLVHLLVNLDGGFKIVLRILKSTIFVKMHGLRSFRIYFVMLRDIGVDEVKSEVCLKVSGPYL